MAKLTDTEAQLFLDPNFGVVGTVGPNGAPQTTVVWIDWDGENVVFNTTAGPREGTPPERDPRVSISVCDRDDPYRSLEVEGTAELDDEGADDHIAHALAEVQRPRLSRPDRPRDRPRPAGARPHLRARLARCACRSRSATSGPRDGLQNEPETLPVGDPRRARLAPRRDAGCRGSRRSRSSATTSCRRWPAPRRSSPAPSAAMPSLPASC